jgi:integrase
MVGVTGFEPAASSSRTIVSALRQHRVILLFKQVRAHLMARVEADVAGWFGVVLESILEPMILERGMGGSLRRHGYAKRRKYVGGRVTWSAMYLVAEPDVYMSAGTFATKAEANEVWQDKLGQMRQGLLDDPRKGRMPFADFCVLFLELMTHQKTNTRKNYRGLIERELITTFGHVPLNEVSYELIARWVTSLRERERKGRPERGLAGSTIRSYKALLSGILTTAVELGYIAHNPALRVKTPREKPRRITAATGAEISALMDQMPGPVARMVVHLAVQSGCRWGELSELRGADVLVNPDDPDTDYLGVQRAVADAGADDNPLKDGSRFYVEDTTKGGTDRKIGLSAPLSALLRAYVRQHRIGPEGLLFPLSRLQAEWRAANPEPEPVAVVVPEDLGRTEPNARGRTYAHGTMSAYTAGRCKCDWCRRSFAVYRAQRRARGFADRPTPAPTAKREAVNSSDHCPDDWFRERVWYPALDAADISRHLTFHDLRHTHATWLEVGGIAFAASFDVMCDRCAATALEFRDSKGSMKPTANVPGRRPVKVRCGSRRNNRSTSVVAASTTMMHLTMRKPIDGPASSHGRPKSLAEESARKTRGHKAVSSPCCRQARAP